jgi:RNA polymerase sigma-70 factor (ECF subfamily)
MYFEQGGVKGQKSGDLAQETLIAVWHKASLFDSSKGSCSTWIFTIARNLRYDHFRSLGREILSIGAEELYDQVEDPAYQIDARILSSDFRSKIDSLPADQKDAVHAMYFEGYSHGEYAELRKLPLGTVKSRVRLALAQLKKGLEEL